MDIERNQHIFPLKNVKKILLAPPALLYGAGSGLRNLLYDWDILKAKTIDQVKTISVGNLCAGGSGKTPHVDYLIELLKQEFKVATLSRGYKRKTSGYVLANAQSGAEQIGDEPLLFKQKHPEIQVAVDAKRLRGIQHLMNEQPAPEVVLLDDAYQHRQLKPGLSILLTEYHRLFLHDDYLPMGRLRESAKNIHRADIIIVTKTPEHATSVDMRGILKDIGPRAYQSVYFSYLKYGDLYQLNDDQITLNPPLDLFKFHTLVFCGIANPHPLFTYVKEYAESAQLVSFPDHHDFTLTEIDQLKAKFKEIPSEQKIIITTEKDAMRLRNPKYKDILADLPLFILPVKVDFKNKSEEFNENIFKYVRTNKIYHSKYMQ